MTAIALARDPDSRGSARLTGALYLSIAVAGGFAIGYVPAQLLVAGDAAASLSNVAARRGLFLAAVGADALVMLLEIATMTLLYFMFRGVSATWALAALLARAMMVTVMAGMLFFQAAALALADPGGALAHLPEAQRLGLGALVLHMHHAGVWIWQLFFGLHLAILGQLVARSGRLPSWLGHAMTVGAMGYLADSLHQAAFPDADLLGALRIALLVVVTLSEVGFALWLLLRAPAAPTRPAAAPGGAGAGDLAGAGA